MAVEVLEESSGPAATEGHMPTCPQSSGMCKCPTVQLGQNSKKKVFLLVVYSPGIEGTRRVSQRACHYLPPRNRGLGPS